MADEGFKRKLAAILSADVEGYSRLMDDDEEATVRTLTAYRSAINDLTQQYRGRVIDTPGDNLLAEFTSVVDAVNCAVEIQRELAERNAELPYNRKMEFRIGVNLGDVIEEEGSIYGDGVNISARVEAMAEAGGICISGRAFDQVENKLGLEYENLGEHQVKNITRPIRVYRVLSYPGAAAHRVVKAKDALSKKWRKIALATAAVLVVVIAVAIVWNFYLRPPSVEVASVERMAHPLPDKPSIVVLPFDNLSKDPNQDYLVDGITDQIIIGLSNIPYMFVIARESSLSYKNKDVEVRQISEELGVQYVLEGSVQVSGDRIRITTQLIDALSGHHLWSERYDRELDDLFALQDEIMIKIMQAMQLKMSGLGILDDQPAPSSVEAYKLMLKAIEYVYRFNKNDMAHGRKLYEEAIALSPDYRPFYRLLAWTHFHDAMYGFSASPAESLKNAEKLANKAVSLSDDKAYALLSLIYYMHRQFEKAVTVGEEGLATSSNWANYYAIFSVVLSGAGRDDEAVSMIEKAIRLNPLSPWFYSNAGICYGNAGRYEDAIEVNKTCLQNNPNYFGAWLGLAACYSILGYDEKAHEAAKEFLKRYPSASIKSLRANYVRHIDPAREKVWLDAYRKAGIPENPPLKLPDKPSFAVLPFTNMSGDPEEEYFSDGFTDTIIGALSRLPKLFVIARTSSFYYKGKTVTVKQISRELGVQYLIEGSVQKSGNRLRVTVQLIDALTGGHLWSERYDRNMKDIFEIQDEITLKIVKLIAEKHEDYINVDASNQAGTDNLEAYLKVLKAVDLFWKKTSRDNLERSRLLFYEAIALDPNYLSPYVWLPYIHQYEARRGYSKSPEKSLELGLKMAKKAVELDESISGAHTSLGYMYYNTNQHSKAIEEYKKAMALDPNNPEAYSIGYALCYIGKPQEALTYFNMGERVSPKHRMNSFKFGLAYLCMGKYEDAIPFYQKALKLTPGYWRLHVDLAGCFAAVGRNDEAMVEVKHILKAAPHFTMENYIERLPARSPEDIKYYIEALRKVPFPE
jgi:TolB-like protein/class 3 adenylate cyclase/Tfp pilus assembly protein PilF